MYPFGHHRDLVAVAPAIFIAALLLLCGAASRQVVASSQLSLTPVPTSSGVAAQLIGKWQEVSQNGSPVSPGADTCQYFPDHRYVCRGAGVPAPFHSTWAIVDSTHIRLGSRQASICSFAVSGTTLTTQCVRGHRPGSQGAA